jgi:hypothetical protein
VTGSFENVDAVEEFTTTWSGLVFNAGDLPNFIIHKVGMLTTASFYLHLRLCGDTENQLSC